LARLAISLSPLANILDISFDNYQPAVVRHLISLKLCDQLVGPFRQVSDLGA
jgi:hypothetical protein